MELYFLMFQIAGANNQPESKVLLKKVGFPSSSLK